MDDPNGLVTGAKFLVNHDVLLILYCREDCEFDPQSLSDISIGCDATHFVPSNGVNNRPHKIWIGPSSDRDCKCIPVY